MKKTLKKFIFNNGFLYDLHMKIKFKKTHGYKLNLKDPKTFSEKIQWLKINGNLEMLDKFVDKYQVREYVEKKIGSKHLIPLIGYYESANEIPFNSLPEKFIIKATHSSGQNLIVDNKSNINISEVKNEINSWLRVNYFNLDGEINYKNVKPGVVIERLLDNESGLDLIDYKFFCFNGNFKFVQVDYGRYGEHVRGVYDHNWEDTGLKFRNVNKANFVIDKPKNFNLMIDLATTLANDFNFVRVDLYNVEGQVYFGELTFTPGNGFSPFETKHQDKQIGDFLNLNS